MLEKIKGFARRFLVEPFLVNIVFWMLFIGTVLIIFSSAHQSSGEINPLWEAVSKVGSAILGAGVFGVIMKSVQFTRLFQQNISQVFYTPSEIMASGELLSKWHVITNELLKKVLPKAYDQVSNLIEGQFLNAELEYHFVDYSLTYAIEVGDNNIAKIKAITETGIVLSPETPDPVLRQTISLEGEIKHETLKINDKVVGEDCYVEDPSEAGFYHFSMPLRPLTASKGGDPDEVLRMERVVSFTQDLKEEVHFAGAVGRYVKGSFVVKASITPGYKLYLARNGTSLPSDRRDVDPHGFERWSLMGEHDKGLLLPGNGFMLIALPETREC